MSDSRVGELGTHLVGAQAACGQNQNKVQGSSEDVSGFGNMHADGIRLGGMAKLNSCSLVACASVWAAIVVVLPQRNTPSWALSWPLSSPCVVCLGLGNFSLCEI